MQTLQQLCVNVIDQTLLFALNDMPTAIEDSVDDTALQISQIGYDVLKLSSSALIRRLFDCPEKHRKVALKLLRTTRHLDLSSIFTLESVLKTLTLMARHLNPTDSRLSTLYLPNSTQFNLDILRRITTLYPDLNEFSTSSNIKNAGAISDFVAIALDRPNLTFHVRYSAISLSEEVHQDLELLKPLGSRLSIAFDVESVGEDLSLIAERTPQIKLYAFRDFVRGQEEFIPLQEFYQKSGYVPIEFCLSIQRRADLDFFMGVFRTAEGAVRAEWAQTKIPILELHVHDLKQEELDFFLLLNVNYLNLFTSEVKVISSRKLQVLTVNSCSELRSIGLPNAEGTVMIGQCNALTELSIPRTRVLAIDGSAVLAHVVAPRAERATISACPEAVYIALVGATASIEVKGCPEARKVLAPNVDTISIAGAHALQEVNFPRATVVKMEYCKGLTKAICPQVQVLDFSWCSALEFLCAPKATKGEIYWQPHLKHLNISSFTGVVPVESADKLEALSALSAKEIVFKGRVNPNLKLEGPLERYPKWRLVAGLVAALAIAVFIVAPILVEYRLEGSPAADIIEWTNETTFHVLLSATITRVWWKIIVKPALSYNARLRYT